MFITIQKRWLILMCIAIFAVTVSIAATQWGEKQVSNTRFSSLCIVIDAGHGGIDGGVVGNVTAVKESDINLELAKELKKQCALYGIDSVMTRESADGLYGEYSSGFKKRDMLARQSIIAQSGATLVVSIHQNRHSLRSVCGAQVFYDANNEKGKLLAQYIQKQLNAEINTVKEREASAGDYYMVKCTTLPSVIVESGFLSNEREEKLLLTQEYRERVAKSILEGILKFLQAEGYDGVIV